MIVLSWKNVFEFRFFFFGVKKLGYRLNLITMKHAKMFRTAINEPYFISKRFNGAFYMTSEILPSSFYKPISNIGLD